jgi:hypothetical protein
VHLPVQDVKVASLKGCGDAKRGDDGSNNVYETMTMRGWLRVGGKGSTPRNSPMKVIEYVSCSASLPALSTEKRHKAGVSANSAQGTVNRQNYAPASYVST